MKKGGNAEKSQWSSGNGVPMAKMITKTKNKKTKLGGPFLAAAFFCEAFMEDANKMISAIKILDGCQVFVPSDAPVDIPSKSNPVGISQNLLLIFKTGDHPGKHMLKLVMQQPDGQKQPMFEREIELAKEPHAGITIRSQMTFALFSNGIYWINVTLGVCPRLNSMV